MSKGGKYRKAVEALRDDDAFLAFLDGHPLGGDMSEYVLAAHRVAAEYLESRFGRVEPDQAPVPDRMLDLAAGRVVTATFGTSGVVLR